MCPSREDKSAKRYAKGTVVKLLESQTWTLSIIIEQISLCFSQTIYRRNFLYHIPLTLWKENWLATDNGII